MMIKNINNENCDIYNFNEQVIIKDNQLLVASQAADIFADCAGRSVDERGRFTVALSGGSTPLHMYRLLTEEPYLSTIPWKSTYIFWVDERCVPATDTHSNYGAAQRELLSKVGVPKKQVHCILGSLPPEEGVREYRKTLIDFFGIKDKAFPVFDLIFLGIGTDGHTASLFPGQSALEEKNEMIISVKGGNPHVNRITMTLPLLNQARQIVIPVTGLNKASMVKAILDDKNMQLPARRINPQTGDLTWLLDRNAASLCSGLWA